MENWDAREEKCFARGVGFLLLLIFSLFFFFWPLPCVRMS